MKKGALASLAAMAAAMLAVAGLAACGGGSGKGSATTAPQASAENSTSGGGGSGGAVASIDPCTLLTDAEVATIAPGAGHGKLHQVAGVAKICEWPNSHGLPAVQLQVTAPPSSSLRAELATGVAAGGGYTIVSVSGLGEEAAAAFQKADPSRGLTAGLAILLARSGGKVVGLSTPPLAIKQGSADFTKAKDLVAKAISRL